MKGRFCNFFFFSCWSSSITKQGNRMIVLIATPVQYVAPRLLFCICFYMSLFIFSFLIIACLILRSNKTSYFLFLPFFLSLFFRWPSREGDNMRPLQMNEMMNTSVRKYIRKGRTYCTIMLLTNWVMIAMTVNTIGILSILEPSFWNIIRKNVAGSQVPPTAKRWHENIEV